jgi:ribonuclease HI
MHTIYVDAGYRPEIGGHIAWFNKTTAKSFYEKRNCNDAFRCEYDAILRVLEDHKNIVNEGIEIEILMDNQIVQKKLNRKYGINDDNTREIAMKIWQALIATRYSDEAVILVCPKDKFNRIRDNFLTNKRGPSFPRCPWRCRRLRRS